MLQEEFPRPDFVRPRLRMLNGRWDFNISKADDIAIDDIYNYFIEAPYLPHTELSNLNLTVDGNFLWYRKKFKITKAELAGTIILNFAGVKGNTEVFLNGVSIGTNTFSFSPFAFNISDFAVEGINTLVLKVSSTKEQMLLENIGVWQNIWLEFASKTFIENLHTQAGLKSSQIFLQGKIKNISDEMKMEISLYCQGKKILSSTYLAQETINIQLKIPTPLKYWNPGDGNIYDIKIILKNKIGGICDTIYTYCAFREISIVENNLAINGTQVFLRQIRDKLIYPDSKNTISSIAQIKQDLSLVLKLGFNGVYVEGSIPDPRYLYIADKLGLLVTIAFDGLGYNVDNKNDLNMLINEIDRIIIRDYRHPSIVIWSPISNYFGDKEPSVELYNSIRQSDPTRLISSVAGGYQYYTDIYDKRIFTDELEFFKETVLYATNGPLLSPKDEEKLLKSNPSLLNPDILHEMPLYISGFGIYPLSQEFGLPAFKEEDFLFYYKRYVEIIRESGALGYVYADLYDSSTEGWGLYDFRRNQKISNRAILELRATNLEKSNLEKKGLETLEQQKIIAKQMQQNTQNHTCFMQPPQGANTTIQMPPIRQ